MYIQMVHCPCTMQDDMRLLIDDWCAMMSDRSGWLGGTYGFTDDDHFVGVVRFEHADDAREWAADPDAGLWWACAEALMDGDAEMHASDDVMMMLDGGSDDAGFVQVMHGRVGNADALRRIMSDHDMTSMLHEARPEIIGATLAIEEDGTFTETVAFTDEHAARRGETLEMPAEMTREMSTAMADVQYMDLHKPWFGHR